jgi:hypothetical protein
VTALRPLSSICRFVADNLRGGTAHLALFFTSVILPSHVNTQFDAMPICFNMLITKPDMRLISYPIYLRRRPVRSLDLRPTKPG